MDDEAMSMHELEPSPAEETPITLKQDDYFPEQNHQPSRSSSLGLSGHNTAWWLNRIHRYSSLTFTAFLSLHITNTSLIPLFTRSLPASDTYLLLTRPYYQSPLMEPALVILPLTLHITSGLALRLYRRRQTARWYGAESRAQRRKLAWPKLSWTSAAGYALVPMLAAHILVNRVVPLYVEGGSSGVGLQYLAHGFAKHRAAMSVAYAAMVGTASWHVVWGWAKWMGLTPDGAAGMEGDGVEKGLRRKRRWYGVNGVAAVVAGLWMAGGLGVVARGGEAKGWVGKGFDGLYRSVPVLGKWL